MAIMTSVAGVRIQIVSEVTKYSHQATPSRLTSTSLLTSSSTSNVIEHPIQPSKITNLQTSKPPRSTAVYTSTTTTCFKSLPTPWTSPTICILHFFSIFVFSNQACPKIFDLISTFLGAGGCCDEVLNFDKLYAIWE